MLFQQEVWKEISYKEYSKLLNKFNKKYPNEFERIFYESPVRRSIKRELIEEHVNGAGILEYIKICNELENKELSNNSYTYKKRNGYETCFMGGEESCKGFKEMFLTAQ